MANVGAANAYVTNWAEGLALGSFADAGNLPPDPGSHGSISIETYMSLPHDLSFANACPPMRVAAHRAGYEVCNLSVSLHLLETFAIPIEFKKT